MSTSGVNRLITLPKLFWVRSPRLMTIVALPASGPRIPLSSVMPFIGNLPPLPVMYIVDRMSLLPCVPAFTILLSRAFVLVYLPPPEPLWEPSVPISSSRGSLLPRPLIDKPLTTRPSYITRFTSTLCLLGLERRDRDRYPLRSGISRLACSGSISVSSFIATSCDCVLASGLVC